MSHTLIRKLMPPLKSHAALPSLTVHTTPPLNPTKVTYVTHYPGVVTYVTHYPGVVTSGGDQDVAAAVPYRCLLAVPAEAEDIVTGRQGRHAHPIDDIEVEPPAPESGFFARAPIAFAASGRTEAV